MCVAIRLEEKEQGQELVLSSSGWTVFFTIAVLLVGVEEGKGQERRGEGSKGGGGGGPCGEPQERKDKMERTDSVNVSMPKRTRV